MKKIYQKQGQKKGLIAHYGFEENANGSSGNSNDGIEYKLNYGIGKNGQPAMFDGKAFISLHIEIIICPITCMAIPFINRSMDEPEHHNVFHGKVDELRIYNRAISEEEINLMNKIGM